MLKISNIFYGWIIVSISTLVFAIGRGVNDAFSVFFVAILEEFGWSRAAVAGVFSLARLTEGSISIGVGMLSDRFGLRRLVPVSACLVALGLVLASQARTTHRNKNHGANKQKPHGKIPSELKHKGTEPRRNPLLRISVPLR